MSVEHVYICGAGLVGSLMGVVLREKGFKVTIYERYEDVRTIPALGRSINLVLTSRGLRAVHMVSAKLLKEMLAIAVPVTGRIMHQMNGEKVFQRYGKDDSEHNFSISRIGLNKFLINKAEAAGCKILFNHALERVSNMKGESGAWARLHFKGGKVVNCNGPLFACDGAGSRIRYSLRDLGLLTFKEDFCVQGYKEIMFPAHTSLGLPKGLEKHGLHIWPRGSHFLMALKNLDDSFTGTIYIDNKGPVESFEALKDYASVKKFMEKHYADAIPYLGGMDVIAKQIVENHTGLLGSVHTSRHAIGNKVILIGDAAHAITPFFGQGTNCGFEDVFIISQLLSKYGTTPLGFDRAFGEYTFDRVENADAIATMALENFVEMRDLVGREDFLLRKGVQLILENKFPDIFRSRYAMVCYGGDGNITYNAALVIGKLQWKILDELSKDIEEPSEVDLVKAEKLIFDQMPPLLQQLKVDLTKISHTVSSETKHASRL